VAYWKINEGVGTAVADSSPSGLAATMFNSPTWSAGGPMTPAAPDVTPPQISNVALSGITDTGVTITFSTNEPTTGWVSYTLTESCPCTDVYSQTPNATSHTISLTGLAPDTTFTFEAKATDAAGNFQVGSSMTFRTLATPTDTTPPTASITHPAAGAVAGTVLVEATATDDVGVVGVQFRLDGANLGAEDTVAPYSISWDTRGVSDGPHTVTAVSRDAAGNQGTASVAVTVSNSVPPADTTPPEVFITRPLAGAVVGTVLVEATATDDVGVVGVQFRLDGANLGAEDTVAPYSISWDTRGVSDGPHTVTAVSRDAAGNVGTFSIQVNVSNGVVTGTPYYLDLNGVNQYLEVSDSDRLSFGNGSADAPLTFEMWLRPDTMSAKQNLLSRYPGGANQEYRLSIAANSIRLDLYDSSAQATVSAYTSASQASLVGGWHHLAVTYDGRGGATAANGITIYVDGVAVALTRSNSAAYVAMENRAIPLQIGREGTNWKQYDGGLDELRIWDLVRTQAQIQAAMSTELTGAEPGLVAYWKINEGVGTAVADSSPSGLAATMFNSPTWSAGGPMTQ
jgi:mRNA-degrading endonuclease toxin of MazEF toxin-antitoxin module